MKIRLLVISIIFILLFIVIPHSSTFLGEEFGHECNCLGLEIVKSEKELYCFGFSNKCESYGSTIHIFGPIKFLSFIVLTMITLHICDKNNI